MGRIIQSQGDTAVRIASVGGDTPRAISQQKSGDISIVAVDGDTMMTMAESNPVIYRGSGDYDHYTGQTTVTPSQQTQTLFTADHILDRNIIINPIPSNYGLITWNGATLTVS